MRHGVIYLMTFIHQLNNNTITWQLYIYKHVVYWLTQWSLNRDLLMVWSSKMCKCSEVELQSTNKLKQVSEEKTEWNCQKIPSVCLIAASSSSSSTEQEPETPASANGSTSAPSRDGENELQEDREPIDTTFIGSLHEYHTSIPFTVPLNVSSDCNICLCGSFSKLNLI